MQQVPCLTYSSEGHDLVEQFLHKFPANSACFLLLAARLHM